MVDVDVVVADAVVVVVVVVVVDAPLGRPRTEPRTKADPRLEGHESV